MTAGKVKVAVIGPGNIGSARMANDPRDILVELGRRKVVGGQEDMIVDVAHHLATRSSGRRSPPPTWLADKRDADSGRP